VLHQTCENCGQNGHRGKAHEKKDFVQLEQQFRKWNHQGLLTSLVFLTHKPECRKFMTPSVWKFGQWRQSLEDCPGNAYYVEERKPTFNDVSGERAEKRRLRTEIAKFKMLTGSQLSDDATRTEFEEAKVVWETSQEAARKSKLENPAIKGPIKIWPVWTTPKGTYMQDADGNIVPNPNFRKGKPERRERGRGHTRGSGQGRRDRHQSDESRSRSHHLDWRNFE
jgi:hypothetical protein